MRVVIYEAKINIVFNLLVYMNSKLNLLFIFFFDNICESFFFSSANYK